MSLTIGIRAEDKSDWERRVPLVPDDVARLVRETGLRVLVEPSARRVFPDAEFRDAGAEIASDLSPAKVIFGVKEVPPEKLLRRKAYVFFAHVIKGQRKNMPLLGRLLDLGATLIDYERIVDGNGNRLVLFGREAGQAGMIDALHFLGQRWARDGFSTPLERIRPAHGYDGLAAAQDHITETGDQLRRGADLEAPPVVVALTGRGNVSRGAEEVFDWLSPEEVAPEDLAALVRDRAGVRDRLFKVRLLKQHLAAPREPGRSFDAEEFNRHPERFRSRLGEFLPYVTLLVNGIYWTEEYPRYLSKRLAAALWREGHRKLRLVADISCDVNGAIEPTYKSTQPDHPTYVYDPLRQTWTDGIDGEGIIILAVDNLPCELPRRASRRFSRALRRFVPAIAAADYARPFAELELPPQIRSAVITHRGELTPDYGYLRQHLD